MFPRRGTGARRWTFVVSRLTVHGVRAARTTAAKTDEPFRSWLRGLRERAGMSQEELAAAIGTDRRNIRRWEVEGHDPAGTVLLRILSALGVGLTVSPELPGAINAELQELRALIDADREEAERRHDELVARLDAQAKALRVVTARRPERTSRSASATARSD
jgi:transcriptional regulator with XRE-family HTH domain